MKKPIVINDWAVVESPHDMYTAPELVRQYLNGVPVADERFTPGQVVTTSSLAGKRAGCVVTKSGSLYQLGAVRAEYAAKFPDAEARLLKTLPEI